MREALPMSDKLAEALTRLAHSKSVRLALSEISELLLGVQQVNREKVSTLKNNQKVSN
jgi:hypothetical protein